MRNNFVAQIEAFYYKMTNDPKITPGHITTYLALANFWSMAGYAPTFNVKPEDVMAYAKLDNHQELRNCLKHLKKAAYIKTYQTRIPSNGIGIKLVPLYRNDKHTRLNDNIIVK